MEGRVLVAAMSVAAVAAVPVTFFQAYPTKDLVCFSYGPSLTAALTREGPEQVGPLVYNSWVPVEVSVEFLTVVAYTTPGLCGSGGMKRLLGTGVVAISLHSETNVVGLTAGGAGPSLSVMKPATHPDDVSMVLFEHHAANYTSCSFNMLGFSQLADDPVPVGGGKAVRLRCANLAHKTVEVTCDGTTANRTLQPSDLCSSASRHFLAIGDKADPVNFPLKIMLVQGAMCFGPTSCASSGAQIAADGDAAVSLLILVKLLIFVAIFSTLLCRCCVVLCRGRRRSSETPSLLHRARTTPNASQLAPQAGYASCDSAATPLTAEPVKADDDAADAA